MSKSHRIKSVFCTVHLHRISKVSALLRHLCSLSTDLRLILITVESV